MSQFPEIILMTKVAPTQIDLGLCLVLQHWYTPTRRYWVTRNQYGYAVHMEVLTSGKNGNSWCCIYMEESYESPYTFTLAAAVNRIEEVIQAHKRQLQEEELQRQEVENNRKFYQGTTQGLSVIQGGKIAGKQENSIPF